MTSDPSMLAAPVNVAATPAAAATPINPPALTVMAGRPVFLTGDGSVCAFDFGDPSARFNSLRGYNAAHIYDTPGSYLATATPAGAGPVKTQVTVIADSRPVISLAADENLAAALAHITAPTIVLLPAGATYDVSATIALSVNGVTLRAAPAKGDSAADSATAAASQPPCIRRIATPGSYSTLAVGAADISIEGITFDSNQPLKPAGNGKVGIYGLNIMGRDLLVRGCTFRNVDDALHCQAKARGLLAIDCQFTGELRSCAAYLDAMQNVTLLACTAAGSVCEHIFRLEGNQNVLIHGCDVNNEDGKETIAIRVGQCVAVTSNTIRAWARISQGAAAVPSIYCRNILFAANHFAGLRPIGCLMQINPGSQSVVFDGNTFDVDAKQVAVAVQAPVNGVCFTNNHLSMVNGATSCRPLVDPFGNPLFTESGTAKSAA